MKAYFLLGFNAVYSKNLVCLSDIVFVTSTLETFVFCKQPRFHNKLLFVTLRFISLAKLSSQLTF